MRNADDEDLDLKNPRKSALRSIRVIIVPLFKNMDFAPGLHKKLLGFMNATRNEDLVMIAQDSAGQNYLMVCDPLSQILGQRWIRYRFHHRWKARSGNDFRLPVG